GEDRGVPRAPPRPRHRVQRGGQPRRQRVGGQPGDAPRGVRALDLLPGPRRHPPRARRHHPGVHPGGRGPRAGPGPGPDLRSRAVGRLRQVPRGEAAPVVTSMYDLLFGPGRDPVAEPGTATGTPGDWWTTFAL